QAVGGWVKGWDQGGCRLLGSRYAPCLRGIMGSPLKGLPFDRYRYFFVLPVACSTRIRYPARKKSERAKFVFEMEQPIAVAMSEAARACWLSRSMSIISW